MLQHLHFDCDYMEGAHPAILARLSSTNLGQTPGYGVDAVCEQARERIRFATQCPQAAVYFLVGGTQANVCVLDQLLRPWEGVISANTGHINGHEAGALEACGHKILPLDHKEGKLDAANVEAWCKAWEEDEARDHIVAPGVVYISQPTEYGTLYSLEELQALRKVCDRYQLRLFVDGARLGYGLAGVGNTCTLPQLAQLADAFSIGGTKVGALFGEAVVFPKPQLAGHFFTLMKKRGALMAKGRMLGLQFDALFEEDESLQNAETATASEEAYAAEELTESSEQASAKTEEAEGTWTGSLALSTSKMVPVEQTRYMACATHAIQLAQKLAAGFVAAGYELAMKSPTNQQFVVMDEATVARLRQQVSFEAWERRGDGKLVMRFVTSWATRPEAVEELLALL